MSVLARDAQFETLLANLADSVGGAVRDRDAWAIVGIRSRGDVIAQRLADRLKPPHVGTLDITLYRDDLSEIGSQPVVRTTEIDFNIDRLDVVLVDDVLMTGRSVRAALQSLMDFGRPRRVWLAVLVDRGGRELPIAADFVALDLTKGDKVDAIGRVDVRVMPTDAEDAILVRPRHDEEQGA
jgi:pyrimidine operon attenuation protein/uracil phosphoribosyltransferase